LLEVAVAVIILPTLHLLEVEVAVLVVIEPLLELS
jgi:hypothetical protein